MKSITVPIVEVCQPISLWDPRREAPTSSIDYIDIAAIDRTLKQVTSPTRVLGKEAPSRARQIVQHNDVLVSSVRPNLNAVALVPQELNGATASTGFVVLRADPTRVSPPFLYHWVRTPWFVSKLVSQATGASYPAVTDRIVRQTEMPLPPLAEQSRIADLLDKADKLRAARLKTVNLLDSLLQATFLNMFGDPVTNPQNWPRKAISEFGVVTTGNTPSRSRPEYYGPGIEWVKSDNLNTPYHVVTPAAETLSEAGERAGRTVEAGSILVTCIAGSRSCIGNAALTDRRVAFNQQINAIAPFNGTDTYFTYAQILVGKELIQAASTSGMKGLVSKTQFSAVQLIAPPKHLQAMFGSRCNAITNLHGLASKSAACLELLIASLRDDVFGRHFSE